MSSQVNRLAYVGNLPADATQEEMKQLCSQVGPVTLFRIVYDRQTGKSKGYGFCEYRDSKLVDVAVDLLHDFEHRGTRLYVRRANNDKQMMDYHNNHNKKSNHNHNKNGNSNHSNLHNSNMNKKKKKMSSSSSSLLSSSKRKSVDEISRVVSSFSTSEKREILSQMKVLIEQNEKGAKEILLENPQLAQALLLIQMEFNLVKPNDIHALTKNVNNNPQIIVSPQPVEPQQSQQPSPQQQSQPSPPQQSQPPLSAPPPQQQPAETDNDRLQGLSAQQQKILALVKRMTADEIAKLPQNVQKQVRAVQAQLAKHKKK